MPAKLSLDEFAVLVRRAELELTPAQLADMYRAWIEVAPMLDRIRGHERGREAEPALIFRPEPQERQAP